MVGERSISLLFKFPGGAASRLTKHSFHGFYRRCDVTFAARVIMSSSSPWIILDKKNSVQATLLFKQNWSENFLDKESTSSRVFKGELKKHVSKT